MDRLQLFLWQEYDCGRLKLRPQTQVSNHDGGKSIEKLDELEIEVPKFAEVSRGGLETILQFGQIIVGAAAFASGPVASDSESESSIKIRLEAPSPPRIPKTALAFHDKLGSSLQQR